WLKEQKEKSGQQQIEPVTAKNVKSDIVNKEIIIVESRPRFARPRLIRMRIISILGGGTWMYPVNQCRE
ncbi:11176_t:CDS:2, partial [Gigaspora rosea]